MAVGLVLSLSVTEPENLTPRPRSMSEAFIAPFSEYFARSGWRAAALALFFMVTYKLGDNMATALATPFYLDLGFTLTEIGLVAKNAALWPALLGDSLVALSCCDSASIAHCGSLVPCK